MPRYVDVDFETASAADLPVCGAWVYAQHPTTEILCLSYHVDGWPLTWFPTDHDVGPLRTLAEDPEVVFVAHSAGFEQAIWSEIMVPAFGLPPLPPERWEDTMATAAWKVIPLKLERGAHVLNLPLQKDMEGSKITLAMSKPKTKAAHEEEWPGPEWGTKAAWMREFQPDMMPERTPEKLARIADYCAQDVAVEASMRRRIGLLSEQSKNERKIWLYDQTINQRGVRLDLEFVRQAQLVIERASAKLMAEFCDLTEGIKPTQRDKVLGWCSTQGVALDNLQKGYLTELLGEDDEHGEYVSLASEDDVGAAGMPVAALPQTVRRVLEIRQMLGSASIKKLARMQACVCEDGRARGLLQYHAAGPGRWGGRLFQPQNFPRPDFKDALGKGLKIDPNLAVDAIMTGDPEFVELVLGCPAIAAVAYSLRHALIPDPGKVFLVGDFAGIEARIVLALAGQHDKTAMMAAGRDVYLDLASVIFGEPVTDKEDPRRHSGKGGVLGCGFQCGAINFNEKFLGGKDLDLAYKTVGAYRNDWAPRVPPLWYALGDASLAAVKDKRAKTAYGITYELSGDGWLTASLPCGWQKLWYALPRLGIDDRFNRECWEYHATKAGQWKKIKAYGGLLTENAVQGLARGLLCGAVDRLERAGMPIVLTVHDEAICEVDEGSADLKAFEELMAHPPQWARDMQIPIAVEAWQGDRYRK